MSDLPVSVRVDIVSDVVCPWCIVGYRQLEAAARSLEGRVTLETHWHPFELNPHLPPEGQNLREHIAQKYGAPPEASRATRARLTQLGRDLDFNFDFFDDMRIYNTFAAHQLLTWAAEDGRDAQHRLKQALFAAYFSDRQDVSDSTVLIRVATELGLDGDDAAAVLGSGRLAEAVREEERVWVERGIHGVPALLFHPSEGTEGGRPLLVTGAQGAPAMAEALLRVTGLEPLPIA